MDFHTFAAAPEKVAPFSHAVSAGPLVFLTGQMPTWPGEPDRPMPSGAAAQTERVMENLTLVLGELGLALGHVAQMRVFLTDFERDYAAMNAAYERYFEPGRLPARTCVGVTGLAVGALVEIDGIAVRP